MEGDPSHQDPHSKSWTIGIGELDGITAADLSGIDFGDITDLEPLYAMDDLTELWLVDTRNVAASDLDLLLDNLETIERTDTEGILYMTGADFDRLNTAGGGLLTTWHREPGHHVEFIQIGDVNHDGMHNGLDVDPFVDVVLASQFDVAADMNGDGAVSGLDVDHFVTVLVGDDAQQIPEPPTLLLGLLALGVVGGWRRWSGCRCAVDVSSVFNPCFIRGSFQCLAYISCSQPQHPPQPTTEPEVKTIEQLRAAAAPAWPADQP
jgi:hypothetical protein